MTKRLVPALFAAILAAAGCSDKHPPASAPPSSAGAGLGSSTAAPTGAAYAPPTGITFGEMSGDTDACSGASYGEGFFVTVCISITSTNGTDTTVTFPAGLIFVSGALTTQNGMVLQDMEVTVPANATTEVTLYLFCANAHRDASGSTDSYAVGPITDVPALGELLSLLSGKDLSATVGTMPAGYEEYEDAPASFLAQDMLWIVTEGGTLSEADKAAIAALP